MRVQYPSFLIFTTISLLLLISSELMNVNASELNIILNRSLLRKFAISLGILYITIMMINIYQIITNM